MAEKDTVFYPSPTPKRQGTYRVLTIDGKCECGFKLRLLTKKRGTFNLEPLGHPKKHNQKCPDCGKEYHINWTEEQRTYL